MAVDAARIALDKGGTDLAAGAHGTASFEAPDDGYEREP